MMSQLKAVFALANHKSTLSLLLLVHIIVFSASCHGLSKEDYTTYQELEDSLIHSSNNESIPNLYILANAFFPQGQEPVCLPINYYIGCENHLDCSNSNCINCTEEAYATSYLWTLYDINFLTGTVLLSYARDGIELFGFNNWEKFCPLSTSIDLTLHVNLTYNSREAVLSSLKSITSQLKQYSASQGKPKVGDSDNKGFAIEWNVDDQVAIFETPNFILTLEFVFLNIFIFFLSISMTTYTYDTLYQNVKRKKNPGYPLFWGLVVFTLCWNVAPSWLVVVRYSNRLIYSLAIMIPLQFFVALSVKKKSNFPIPGMSPVGCVMDISGYHSIFELAVITSCRCLITHLVQVIALWSILVTFTFLAYYLTAITVTFYLSPATTLIKVVFAKGIAVCIILIFSLVFSLSKFMFKCTRKAAKNNCVVILSLLTVITFMPILIYIAFVIGGIIFVESNDNTIRSILTLLPSAFLLFIAWISRGRLFPEGLHDADPAAEIASDLEKGATHKSKRHSKEADNGNVQVPLTPSPSTYGSTHGSTHDHSEELHSPSSDDDAVNSDKGEHNPLLHAK